MKKWQWGKAAQQAQQANQQMQQKQAQAYIQQMQQLNQTPPPPPLDEKQYAAARLAQSEQTVRDLQLKFQSLQRAVSSIVLRLKVLDMEQLDKDMKEDGTIPLRLALSELKALVAAYDGMPRENIPDFGYSTAQQYYQSRSPSASPSVTPTTWASSTATYPLLGGTWRDAV